MAAWTLAGSQAGSLAAVSRDKDSGLTSSRIHRALITAEERWENRSCCGLGCVCVWGVCVCVSVCVGGVCGCVCVWVCVCVGGGAVGVGVCVCVSVCVRGVWGCVGVGVCVCVWVWVPNYFVCHKSEKHFR